MTIQGAVYELEQMLSRTDIPDWVKPTIKKVIETIVDELSEQRACRENKMQVLDKIRDEIEALYDSIDTVSHNEYENAYEQGKERAYEFVLDIIDKYKAESEGEDETDN